MPKRKDIKSILVIGAGPIVIGQACEFDYSGSQACKILREEGYKVILVNSNPATIMTDPDFADATYIEPINIDMVSKIIEKEKPDALLPTMGGQTALNVAMELSNSGILKKNHVELIGASFKAIEKAEDRKLFKEAMKEIGLDTPKGILVHDISEAKKAIKEIGLPAIIRPSFTLGGTGGGIAYNKAEYDKKFNQKSSQKKKRAQLNAYNREKGTYGNGDGLDASHIGGKIVGFESQSKNRGRREKSRKPGKTGFLGKRGL